MIILTCFLILQIKFSPFEYEYMNMLEAASLFVGVVTLAAASAIDTSKSNRFDDGSASHVATAVAVVLNTALGDCYAHCNV